MAENKKGKTNMKNKYIEELKETKVLQEEGYTFKEYIAQLQEFQRVIANAVYQEDIPISEAQLDEAISELGKMCRKNKIDPNVATSVKGALKSIQKELAINMAGLSAENYVDTKIEDSLREKKVNFKNVYLSDERNNTEIDNVILTEEGILIFEVKSAKKNVIIDKHGRLLRDEHVCYEKIPITKSMELKRNMLGNKIDEILAEKNLYIPNLYIESYIVFSTPKDKNIKITDKSGLEEYCFAKDIPEILDGHINSGFKYTDEEFEILKKVINEIGHDMQIKTNKIKPQRIIDLTVGLLEQIYVDKDEVEIVEKSNFSWLRFIGKVIVSNLVMERIVDLLTVNKENRYDKIIYSNTKHF